MLPEGSGLFMGAFHRRIGASGQQDAQEKE
jgi:hypothetical protein